MNLTLKMKIVLSPSAPPFAVYLTTLLVEHTYWNYQVIPEEVVHAIFSACKSGNFDLADKEVNNVIAEGYPASQMLSQVPISLPHSVLNQLMLSAQYCYPNTMFLAAI